HGGGDGRHDLADGLSGQNCTQARSASVVRSLAFRPASETVQRVWPTTSERWIGMAPLAPGWVTVPALVMDASCTDSTSTPCDGVFSAYDSSGTTRSPVWGQYRKACGSYSASQCAPLTVNCASRAGAATSCTSNSDTWVPCTLPWAPASCPMPISRPSPAGCR